MDVFPLYYRLIPESLQWLLSKAKYDSVEKCFKNIMQTNDKSIAEDLLSIQVKVYIKQKYYSFPQILRFSIKSQTFVGITRSWTEKHFQKDLTKIASSYEVTGYPHWVRVYENLF